MTGALAPLFGEAALEALLEQDWPRWIGEAFGAGGLGVTGVAVVLVVTVAIGLFNWTESFSVPAVWLALVAPFVAAALPVPVVWRLIGLITVAVAMLFVGLWTYWRRM